MSQPFLIVGLPRTRGAWLSVACSLMRGAICYHEPTASMQRWGQVYGLWAESGYEYVGISDSLLSLHLSHILPFMAPRTLIVNRPMDEVERSLSGLGLGPQTNLCEIILERLAPLRSHKLVREVDFDSLSDVSCVESCLDYLMPGLEIERAKLAEIMHINCQEDLARTRHLAAGADLPAMFGRDVLSQLREKPQTSGRICPNALG